MEKIKVCFAFNHLGLDDGVARAAIGIANYLSKKKNIEVTLRPLFRFDNSSEEFIDRNVRIKPLLGFYFSGLAKVFKVFPKSILHYTIFGTKQYDLEIGFQHGIATVAVVSHGVDTLKHFVWMHGYDEGLALKKYYLKADKIVCVSQHNANRLIKELGYSVPIDYCYNPLDNISIRNQGTEAIDLERDTLPLFVSVGRLSEEKGYLRLIKIFEKIYNEGYRFTFWLIGDGPQKDLLLAEINKTHQNHNIFLLGKQDNPHKFTSKADVFVCSSYSEGYSTACTEAIMLGIPVITTDVPGGQEIINDSNAGMVVGIGDNELYNGLKYVLDNWDIVRKWKYTLDSTKFSYSERCKRIDEILELNQKSMNFYNY